MPMGRFTSSDRQKSALAKSAKRATMSSSGQRAAHFRAKCGIISFDELTAPSAAPGA
jgi:hypothetical protein